MKTTKKMSIDFSNEAIELINKAKKNYYWTNNKRASNSLVINDLVTKVLGCPNDLSVIIVKSLKSMLGHYNLLLLNEKQNQFLIEDFNKKIELIEGIIMLFNVYETKKDKDYMRKIILGFNRSIVFPSDWIVLNEQDALCSSEAYVVECRNHGKYNIPHFLYLGDDSEMKDGDYTQEFRTKLYEIILNSYQDFKIVLNNQVGLIINEGKIMNSSDYEKSPTIGIFKIINSEQLKKIHEFDKKYEPPYNAVVDIAIK